MYGHDHKIMNPAERRGIQLYNVISFPYYMINVKSDGPSTNIQGGSFANKNTFVI